jgi:hypothetical protein
MSWNVELPASASFRQDERRGQVIKKFVSGNFFRS